MSTPLSVIIIIIKKPALLLFFHSFFLSFAVAAMSHKDQFIEVSHIRVIVVVWLLFSLFSSSRAFFSFILFLHHWSCRHLLC